MSDFDAFVTVDKVDDPAAEFLAREKNELGNLEDDFDFQSDPLSQKINGNYENGDSNEFGDTNELNGPNTLSNGDEDHNESVKKINSINSSQSSLKIKEEIKEEPEKIRKWREEQTRLLEEKDREEARKKEELRQTAKHELEEWYARYAEQLEKSKLNNREACKNAEKEWVAERDSEVAGQEWEKIAKMCDFNPKSTRNTKDTSRMRSILLQLKQNPPSGPLKQ